MSEPNPEETYEGLVAFVAAAPPLELPFADGSMRFSMGFSSVRGYWGKVSNARQEVIREVQGNKNRVLVLLEEYEGHGLLDLVKEAWPDEFTALCLDLPF